MTEARRTVQFVLYKGKPQRHSGSQFYVFARTARQCVYFRDFAIATMRRCVTISRVRSIDRSMSFSPFVDLFLFPSIFMSVDFVWARFRGFEVSIFPALGLLGFGILGGLSITFGRKWLNIYHLRNLISYCTHNITQRLPTAKMKK